MQQQTSLEAFISFKKNLGLMQEKIFRGFLEHGPCTNLELSEILEIPINQITPRNLELRNYKPPFLVEHSRRFCKISGRRALVWAVPDTIVTKKWEEV